MKKIILAVTALVLTFGSFSYASPKKEKKESCCHAGATCCKDGTSCCKSK